MLKLCYGIYQTRPESLQLPQIQRQGCGTRKTLPRARSGAPFSDSREWPAGDGEGTQVRGRPSQAPWHYPHGLQCPRGTHGLL